MERKLRLLRICFNDLGHGGIQSQFMNVTKQLSEKVETDLIVWTSEPGYYEDEFKKYGRIINIPHYEGKSTILRKLDFFIRYFRVEQAVYDVIKKYGPYDAVHCHKFFECAPCMAAAYKASVPVRIAQSHNTGLEKTNKGMSYYVRHVYYRVYRRIINKYATHKIGCSQVAADYLFGKGEGKALYNGIVLERFDIDKIECVKHDGIRLLHVGKFCIQKNQLFLIDVLNELLKQREDVCLTLVGDGVPYINEVREKVNKLGVDDKVEILAHNTDIPKVMANADLFVFPSTFEGFGNVLLEAQAIGMKCVVSTEITKEADCGLLHFIDLRLGAFEWANYINRIINSEGIEKVKVNMERFSATRMASQLYEIYRGDRKIL